MWQRPQTVNECVFLRSNENEIFYCSTVFVMGFIVGTPKFKIKTTQNRHLRDIFTNKINFLEFLNIFFSLFFADNFFIKFHTLESCCNIGNNYWSISILYNLTIAEIAVVAMILTISKNNRIGNKNNFLSVHII